MKIFHNFFTVWVSIVMTLALISCNSGNEPKIDWEQWRNDVSGCSGYRNSQIDLLREFLSEIEKMNSNDIVDLMGQPDDKNLLKRSQRDYRYYLEPNYCGDDTPASIFLWIRFGAIGNVSECLIIEE